MHHYFIIYKPYLTLSQFTSEAGKQTLASYFDVPKDVYPVGRLDSDSEGLLLLTNDPSINHQLLQPANKHQREYWVQVDGAITPTAIQQLQKGVMINVDGKLHKTLPCIVKLLPDTLTVPPRDPPIRFRKNIPTSWLSITLVEGKNRQVRKMTAQVGFPTLRLIRYRIEKLTIDGLLPTDIREISKSELHQALFKSGH